MQMQPNHLLIWCPLLLTGVTLSKGIERGLFAIENEQGQDGYLYSTVRMAGHSPIKLRTRGSRTLEEIPPSELHVVGRVLCAIHEHDQGSVEHLKTVLEHYDLIRLTEAAEKTVNFALNKEFGYTAVDTFF